MNTDTTILERRSTQQGAAPTAFHFKTDPSQSSTVFPAEIHNIIASYLVPHAADWGYEHKDKFQALKNMALAGEAWQITAYEYLHCRIEVAPEWRCDGTGVCYTPERYCPDL